MKFEIYAGLDFNADFTVMSNDTVGLGQELSDNDYATLTIVTNGPKACCGVRRL